MVAFKRPMDVRNMVHPEGAAANLLEVMQDWNKQLQHTSLGQDNFPKPKTSKDGRSPRRRASVTARRRLKA